MVFLKKITVLFFMLISVLLSQTAQARDLTHRLAVGIKNNTSVNLPGVGAVYYAQKDLAYTGLVGIDTQKDNSAMQVAGGVRSIVFFENNLNAYWTGQLGFASTDTLANGRNSGMELFGGAGVEFFFAGLENLSFTVEVGLGVSSLHNTRVFTSAQDPFHAGVMFYF